MDHFWMRRALQEALLAKERGEVPVGAVVVSMDNQLLGSAHNRVISENNPCAHAEILALQAAAKALGNYRLNDCTIFVTLEPCAMCAGALIHARIQRLVFATRDFKTGAAGSVLNIPGSQLQNHRIHIDEGVLQSECAQVLSAFFEERRW